MNLIIQFLKKNRILIFQIATSFIFLFSVYTYFHTIRKYSVNFPFGDDYNTILGFLNLWEESDSKISILFAQYNEHRLVFLRIVSLIYLKVFHTINFSHLILMGNTFIVLCILLLYYTIKDKRKFILISPIFLAIFNFSNWETQTWAMASLSNYPVIYFGFLSLYFLSKNKFINFVLGIFFAVIAVFCQGNGMFVFLSGVPLLFKNKSKLFFWLLIFIMIILLYFIIFPYTKPIEHPEFFSNTKFFFLSRVYYGFALLSNVFDSKFVFIFGMIPFLTILYLYKNYSKISKLHLSMISFLLFSLSSLVITRGGFGFEQAFSSRYHINTLFLYSLIYICLYPFIRIKKHFLLILSFALIFYYNTNLLNIPQLKIQKNKITIDKACMTECLEYKTFPNTNRARELLINFSEKGFFGN
ncbi:hypothetical protein [Leptospira noguchii]|uniref:Putative membrane protein n=1 Tax=Leptospira noguchii TaxID=28182 RepID=M6V428_9LEPT|nr:hypothetical protein [Leptospira noguchii]EMO52187.1 putative membrane protein [Leptospira noguchii]